MDIFKGGQYYYKLTVSIDDSKETPLRIMAHDNIILEHCTAFLTRDEAAKLRDALNEYLKGE